MTEHEAVEWAPACSDRGTPMRGQFEVVGEPASPKAIGRSYGAEVTCPNCGLALVIGPDSDGVQLA